MSLSEKQKISIYDAVHAFNIWVGSVRSGKTFASILRFIELLTTGVKGDVMIIGVSRESIQRNVINDLYKLLGFPPPGSKTNSTRLFGRNIFFVGAHDESAVRTIQGSTLALAYVDEATCIPAPFWRMLVTRLSVPGAQLLATCNPESPSHWLKKEYLDKSANKGIDLIWWQFTLDDNPSLDDAYKQKIKNSFSGMFYRRYILGEWAVAHGVIYDAFDDDNIYEHPFDAPNYYAVGIDYGTTNATAAVLAAISPRRWPQIRIEDMYYYDSVVEGRTKTDQELVMDIKKFIGWKNVQSIFVDPSAASLRVALQRDDLPVIEAKNDVIPGIRVTSQFISNKNIVIHKSCEKLIDQIQSYQWDPKAADRGEDKPIKRDDHAVDALRYLCYSLFPNGEFSSPYEHLSIDQLRKHVYGYEESLIDNSNVL